MTVKIKAKSSRIRVESKFQKPQESNKVNLKRNNQKHICKKTMVKRLIIHKAKLCPEKVAKAMRREAKMKSTKF